MNAVIQTADAFPSNECDNKPADVVKLRHPRTGESSSYLLSNGGIQEILSFDEGHRSWFIGESVQQDGQLFICTPIDPLFCILPYFEKQTNQLEPLDVMIEDKDFPETQRLILLNNLHFKQLEWISDRKGAEELNIFKYNESKTLSWLKMKVEHVVKQLERKGISENEGAVSVNYIKGGKEEQTGKDNYLLYAHGIVSAYLTSNMSSALFNYLELKVPQQGLKRKSKADATEATNKKSKVTPTEDYLKASNPENKVKPVTSTKSKQLARSASGTKSITSFFKKS